jgi:putative nucleotidyltransferase with HDIG domain
MNDENRTKQALNDRLQEMRRLLGEMQPGSGQAGETRQESESRFRRLIKTSEAIAAVVGERDPYKKGHQFRVTDLACAIGMEMDLSRKQIDGIRIGGLLHDIGKMSTPTEILVKPTRLTEKEKQLMRTHVQSGYEILKDTVFPWPITRMVLEHHERLDGSGYPKGLTADQLIMESRIMAVADVVEAIASPRSYRPARGIDVALYDIKGDRGIRYDPEAVDACLRLFYEQRYKMLDD